MVRRLLSLVVVLGGCWSEEPLVFDAFTPDQWARLQAMYKLEPPHVCTSQHCRDVEAFGQQLFFEPALSGPGTTSCATCHDASGWYVDTRAENAVSHGAEKSTKRNTITLVNVGRKSIYTWSGECKDLTGTVHDCASSTDVIHDIALPNAMASTDEVVARAITTNISYSATYARLFPNIPTYRDGVELALTAYMQALDSMDSKFDRFIAGKADAMEPAAIRGFALFVSRAMCVDCHSGPLFTDGQARVTGVENTRGDTGRGGTGAFYTPSLRQVAETGPYMHNGSIQTLGEVLRFYRDGGGWGEYVGDKDPLMEALPLDDDDLRDLEAFMRALTGSPVSAELRADTHGGQLTCAATDGNPGYVCNGTCTAVVTDANNCGACGHTCGPMEACMGGCYALDCVPPTMACNHACVDIMTDPANCGGCGHVCGASTPVCSGGACQS